MPEHPFMAGAVPIPNAVFDEVLPALGDTELRVLLVVLRQTLGWREGSDFGGWRFKRRDWISHTQLMRKTGRGSEAVSRAVASLVASGLIVAEDDAGQRLKTADQRRRAVGRVYLGPGEKWKTGSSPDTAQPNSTTDNWNNIKDKPPTSKRTTDTTARTQGWQRAW